VWVAHDIGQAIHKAMAIGQVEGGVYMGLGEALMEEMTYRGNRFGVHKFPSMLEYKSLTTMEMPDIETYLVEDPDPNGPFGAKEAGQGPLLPMMPAVANAVYDALGVRVDEIPVTPDKVLKALDKAAGKPGRYGPTRFPQIDYPEPLKMLTPEQGGDGVPLNDPDRPRKPRAAEAPAAGSARVADAARPAGGDPAAGVSRS
jgi:hypothetical protein